MWGGGGEGGLWGSTKNRGVMKVGVLFIRISKGHVGDQIIFIVTQSKSFNSPPLLSSDSFQKPGLFVGLFSSHEGFSCLGNLKD